MTRSRRAPSGRNHHRTIGAALLVVLNLWAILGPAAASLAHASEFATGAIEGSPASSTNPALWPAKDPSVRLGNGANYGGLPELPHLFVEDVGQFGSSVGRFTATVDGYRASFADGRVILAVRGDAGDESTSLTMTFEGSGRTTSPRPSGDAEYLTNYFLGADPAKWRVGVRSFSEIVYPGAFDGVDVAFFVAEGGLKHEFRLRPYADVGDIRVRYEGALGLSTDGGELVIQTAAGDLRDKAPTASQGDGAPVPCAYSILGPTTYGFTCSDWNHARPLTIDPLVYASYLGGSGTDYGVSVAIDNQNRSVVVGETGSTDFPNTTGAYNNSNAGGSDGFVVRLNEAGTNLDFATYFGGSAEDHPAGVALAPDGSIIVGGFTYSSDFPTTAGAYDTSYAGGGDAFVLNLSTDGASLQFSTYYGGSLIDALDQIDVDAAGAIYLTGPTDSGDFPTSPGAYDQTYGGTADGFVVKLSADGTSRIYSTYIGGTSQEYPTDIVVDSSGNAFITVYTRSSDYPTTPGAYDTSFGGSSEGAVTKLNSSGTGLIYSTYIGGSGFESPEGIAIDSTGAAVVVGDTSSTDFSVSSGAFQTTYAGGSYDIFVTKLIDTGISAIFSTLVGSSGTEYGLEPRLDESGSVFVAGRTDGAGFPTSSDAFDMTYNGGASDAILLKLASDGKTLVYSTFFGGSGEDWFAALARGSNGALVAVGRSSSTDLPTTAGAYLTAPQGGAYDAFVIRLQLATPPSPGSVSVARLNYTCGEQVNLTVAGDFASTGSLQVNDPLARPYLNATVPTNATGEGAFNFTLGSNATNGTYEVYLAFPSSGPFRTNFTVACVPPPPPVAPPSISAEFPTYACGAIVNLTAAGDASSNGSLQINDPLARPYLYATVPTNATGEGGFNFTLGSNETNGTYEVYLTFPSGGPYRTNFTVACVPVVPPLVGPVALITGPNSTDTNVSAVFSGSNSTDDVGVVNWTWLVGDVSTNATAFGENVTYAWAQPGTYAVQLTVRDADNLTDTTSVSIVVRTPPPPQHPIAIITGPRVTDPGSPVSFSGSNSTDADGSVLNWTWTFQDRFSNATLYGANVTYNWSLKGTYTVRLEVRDDDNLTNNTTIQVRVRDVIPPVAVIAYVGDVERGQVIQLNGSASYDDEGGAITNWTWEIGFENGTRVLYGDRVNFSWYEGGSFSVRLTVRDAEGNTGNASTPVHVVVPETPTTDNTMTILIVGGLAALGLGALLATERGLFAILPLLSVPMYARLRKGDLKNQETRSRILQYIGENPGGTYNEIKRGLELPNGTCSYHLRVLERVEEVRRVPQGVVVRFFLADTPSSVREALALPEIERDILWALVDKGEMALSQVVQALAEFGQKADSTTVAYHLRNLQRKHKLVETRREGGQTFYSIPYERTDSVTMLVSKADAKIEAALAKRGRGGGPGGTLKAAVSPEVSVEQSADAVVLTGAGAAAATVAAAASASMPAAGKGLRSRGYLVEEVFVIYGDGRLLTQVGRSDLKRDDAAVVAGMLTAIQDFVKDSFQGEGSLSAMEYEEYRIYVNGGDHIFIAATVFGEGDAQLREELGRATTNIESLFAGVIEEWDGNVHSMGEIPSLVQPILDLTRGLTREDVTRFQTPSPVSVLSALDFSSGFVRLKVGVRNNTSTVVTDCRLEIDYDQGAMRLDHLVPELGRGEGRVTVGNLQGLEKKTVEFYFDPQTCMESFIDGIVRYRDIHGNLKVEKMKRRPVEVVCPIFFTTQNANTAMLKRLVEDELKAKDRKLFRFSKDAEPAKVFELAREVALQIDVRAVRDFTESAPFRGEGWFYGETKVHKRRIVIRVSVDANNLLEFFVAAETDAEVAGLLAEFQRRLTEAVRAQRRVPGSPEPVQDPVEKARRVRERTLLDRHLEGEAPSGDNTGGAG